MKSILFAILVTTGLLGTVTSYSQTVRNDTVYAGSIYTYSIDDLLVYPNPVLSSTRIVLNTLPVSNVYVEVVDMNGNVTRSYQFAPGTYNLDVDMSRLPNGLYTVRVHEKDAGYHNLRVMKQ